MPEWITPVVSVVAIFISFILGSLQSRASYDKKQKQLRYDEFYVPYFKALYVAVGYSGRYSSFSKNDKTSIIDIPLNYIQHLGESSQELFTDFYHRKIIFDSTNSQDDKQEEIVKRLNLTFTKFNEAVIKEAKILSSELHLPDISYTYGLHHRQPM